ncbi:MAG: hypothetical protein NC116_09015 [Clostridium sp.]|nr:hypothetical protein [Bacteroidales bacterium]MCM1510840.1 hypothetical protein [Clostridium sp.]
MENREISERVKESLNARCMDEITGEINKLNTVFGVDGVVCTMFDAVYNILAREISHAQEGGDAEDIERTLRLANEVYNLCEIGKAQITIIEACRRMK